MFNKVYDSVKKYIKENLIFVFLLALIIISANIELPYYINAPGGLINLDKKVVIDNEHKSKGSFNMSYVTEYKPSLLMLGYALINPNCDIIKASDYLDPNDTNENMVYREKLEMQEAVDNAIIYGYKRANKDVNITKMSLYVTYIFSEADTDLEVRDQIIKINGEEIKDRLSFNKIVRDAPTGTKFTFEVINDGKTYTRYATTKDYDGINLVGLTITALYDYDVDPKVEFKFKSNEAGPSGGLMTTLEIYNSLIEEDITKGHKIAGTGTIAYDGAVGPIGGVKYKIKGAVKHHAEVFFVPSGENYDEAVAEKEKNNYNIEVVSISNFDDALKFLNNLSEK